MLTALRLLLARLAYEAYVASDSAAASERYAAYVARYGEPAS